MADVDVIESCGLGFDVRKVWNAVKPCVFARGQHIRLAIAAGFLPGKLGKVSAHYIAGVAGAHEVERDAGKLQRGSALQKEDPVGAGNAEQPAQRGFGVFNNLRIRC